MKVEHISNIGRAEKDCSVDGFALTNKKGDYLWLSDLPRSRYQGWFVFLKEDMYRIIESIEIDKQEDVSRIVNNFDDVEVHRGEVREKFFIPQKTHTFVYELNKKKRISVFFDVRRSYSPEKSEDYYQEEGSPILLRFSNGLYLAVRADEGEVKKEKVKRSYPYDQQRNSPPYNQDVFYALSLYGKRFVFSVAETKEEALREVDKIFVKNHPLTEDHLDVFCAKRSLSDLLVLDKGLYAGLPWFFQFWPRDEAISLKALAEIEKEQAKAILWRLFFEADHHAPRGVVNADAFGWAVKRAEEVNFSKEEKRKIALQINKKEISNEIVINGSNETWMDTLERSEARIEMQAMKLNTLRFLSSLGGFREKIKIKKIERELRNKVREKFFDGENLYDGYSFKLNKADKTIRPNIFIAAYIYPDLLKRKEWIRCFDKAVQQLWLSWGGLSTVDINQPSFSSVHTGEDPQSYHNGDSWFYINNMAAIVLYRTDKKRYAPYIKKIMEASREEMMWMGVIGRSGEVSSAEKLKSQGSPVQAWSAALYIEARKEII